MFPSKSEKPESLGFHPTRASGGRFCQPLAVLWSVGEGCYLVKGKPIAPVEKRLINKRTDYESYASPLIRRRVPCFDPIGQSMLHRCADEAWHPVNA